MTWTIVFILLTLILSAAFSGMEIAFFSAGKLNVEIRKSKGSRKGRIIADFFDNPNDFLSAMLVGNNISLVVFSTLLAGILEDPFLKLLLPNAPEWLPERFVSVLPITLITTVIVLIFGEFLPKIFFRLFADKILFSLAYPVSFFKFILTPLSWLMVNLSERFLRVFIKMPSEEAEGVFTRLDLAKFVESTSSEGEEEELLDMEMFSNVLDMQQTRVGDCMIPRTEIGAVEVSDSVEDLLELFIETNFSKITVYRESIDDIIGYVHHQHLLDKPKNIRSVMRKIPVIPEAMRVQNLMNLFIRERISIACVVDEYGGTSGIITLEDILEEIFGEIEDEHDFKEELLEEEISALEYRFSGRLEIDHLNEKYKNIDFPEGEYSTLSGYIVMTTGTIPEKNQVVELDNYKFIFEMVSETKIQTIRVLVNKKEDNE